MSVTGDACNRANRFNGSRSSTRTFNANSNHHSQSSWSMGWTEPEKAKPSVSANRFASGSNQNCGNVMTDVPTSRVLAPPGGKSNWSIGGGPTEQAPTNRRSAAPFATDAPPATTGHGVGIAGSANAFANGANQNCGNFLTDVPSSRVLAPPGGKSNWSIGGGPSESVPSKSRAPAPPVASQPSVARAPVSKGNNVGIAGSANAFANGANQNCGNFLTDVPSSRVLAPPGGKSNWSIGGGPSESFPAKSRAPAPPVASQPSVARAPVSKGNNVGIAGSANAFANGANQNCGNFLTDVPSSRVLAPPGGKSNWSIGGWTEQAPAATNVRAPAPSAAPPAATKAASPPKLTESTNVAPTRAPVSKGNNVGIAGSANAFANGANQNCGNFLTDVPSSRVLAPPGGRSSITFG